MKNDDRLNLSVDVGLGNRKQMIGKKHIRDHSVRVSGINEEKLNNSVHDFSGNKGVDLEQLSFAKGGLIEEKSLHEKKRATSNY